MAVAGATDHGRGLGGLAQARSLQADLQLDVEGALLAVGADFGATIAMVVSWTLIGYGRAVAWEMPIMGADFTLWRIVISLPMPILAGALGRFVYVRVRHRIKL